MIVYGKQIVLYLLQTHADAVDEIYLAKEIDAKLFRQIAASGKKIVKLDAKKAQALAHGGNHQGFLARMIPFVPVAFDAIKSLPFLVVLSGLTDMGNIGAIVRSAYALGADGIVITGVRDPKFEAIVRASSGAALSMPIAVAADGADALNALRQVGFHVIGATLDGIEPAACPKSGKRALVLGSEGEGFPKKISDKFDTKVTIAMKRQFDSLNVSAAAAILIHAIA